MNKKKILTKFLENKKTADDWIARVPREVNDAFFDNPYINSAELNQEMLLRAVFGEIQADLVLDFTAQDFYCDFNRINTIDGFVEFICGKED